MTYKTLLQSLIIIAMLSFPVCDCWGRGRGGGGGRSMGGGGFSGGGGRSMGGGGFSGGGGRSMGGGGFSGGGNRSMGGGGFNQSNVGGRGVSSGGRGQSNFGSSRNLGSSPGFSGGARQSPSGQSPLGQSRDLGSRPGHNAGGLTGGQRPSSQPAGQRGGVGTSGRGGQSAARSQYSKPSRNQLDGFLGMPSDGGLGSLGSSRKSSGENFDVNRGTAEGPRGGQAAGISVTGPRGNTKAGAAGVGADGGVAKVGGVQGAQGGQAARGAAVGPNGGAVAGSAVRGPNGGAAARAGVAGPAGAAAGFARVTPSGRYTSAVAVRSNYNHWDLYGSRWHTDHPGAWFAAGWTASAIWRTATWGSVGTWMAYPVETPIYYDYGNNVTYQGDTVYVNDEPAGTTQEYYEQATQLAQTGADADAPSDGDWLPLGVFALTKAGGTQSDVSIQLAVNKEGIIRGNYTDTKTGKTQVVQGSVDKETQRVAFSIGDNKSNLIETGLYNLTKDEAPALIHVGSDKTEQWLLVRLKNDQDSQDENDSPAS